MKKPVLLVGLLLLLSAGIAQASYIGAVSMEKRPFQFGLGGGYSFVRSQLDIGSSKSETIQNQFFGLVSFDVKGWQFDVGGGASNWDIEPGQVVKSDIKSGLQPFVRASLGGPIFRGQVLTIAPFIQASAYKGFDKKVSITDGSTFGLGASDPSTGFETVDFDDFYEGVAALRFQVTIEGAHLYAGPAFFLIRSEVKSTYNITDSSAATYSGSKTTDVEANDFGGMAGVRWQLYTGWRLDVEAQWRDGITYTGALSYPF